MFSVYAYNATLASSSAPTYTNLTPVSDPIVTISGNLLYVGSLTQLLGGYVMGPTASKSKLESPSLLNIAPYQIAPVDTAATPSANPVAGIRPSSPRALATTEGLQMYSSNSSSSATSNTTGLVWLADGAIAPVNGNIIVARGTFTSGTTANVWDNAAITFDTQLPAGNYQIVGARAEGAHLKAFRFVFQGQANVRPGSIAANGVAGLDMPGARNGGWGVWGTFNQYNPPSVDNITDGTSETAVLYLDLIPATS